MTAADPFGKGAAFPFRPSALGGVALSTQEQRVHESIRMILGTQVGERLMRPDFGANLKSLTFAPNTQATANLAQHYVEEALNTWEPRIVLLNVVVANDLKNGALIIDLNYRLSSSFEQRNLVYPFYLQQQ